VARGPT